jgi:biotin carboxylase
MVLRRIIGSKKEELKIEERKLYNEDLHGFYTSPDIINARKHKNVRWESYEGRMGWMRNEYTILVGKSEWKRQIGRTGRKRMDTGIMVLK